MKKKAKGYRTWVPQRYWDLWLIIKKQKRWQHDQILRIAISNMKEMEDNLFVKEKNKTIGIHTTDEWLVKEFEKETKRTGLSTSQAIRIALEDILDGLL